MHREHHAWHSPALNRKMDLLVHGHAGARLIVFPTSKGWMSEWEDRGMMHAMGEHIHRGWLQVYSVSSVDAESWYAYHKWPGDRAWRTARRPVLPVARKGTFAEADRMMVRGPGQNFRASALKRGEISRASSSTMSESRTSMGSAR